MNKSKRAVGYYRDVLLMQKLLSAMRSIAGDIVFVF